MGHILDNRRKNQIIASFEINKAYTEGIYSDTPANRKLGRVGMSYSEYNQKKFQKEDEKILSELIEEDIKKLKVGEEYFLKQEGTENPIKVKYKGQTGGMLDFTYNDGKDEISIMKSDLRNKISDINKEENKKKEEDKKWIDVDYNQEDAFGSPKEVSERFIKDIKSLGSSNRKSWGEEALYLVNLHSSNKGLNHFLNSVGDFILKNNLQDYFTISGQYGMYKIKAKNSDKLILEVDASADGTQTLFREPEENHLNLYHIGNHSSTMKTYFKKVCNRIKNTYSEEKEISEKNKKERERLDSLIKIEDNKVIDTTTGLPIGTKNYLLSENYITKEGKLNGHNSYYEDKLVSRRQEIKKIVDKYNLKIDWYPHHNYREEYKKDNYQTVVRVGTIPYNGNNGSISILLNIKTGEIEKLITPNKYKYGSRIERTTNYKDSTLLKALKQLETKEN